MSRANWTFNPGAVTYLGQMAIEIVNFPIKDGDVPYFYGYVSQRGPGLHHPGGVCRNDDLANWLTETHWVKCNKGTSQVKYVYSIKQICICIYIYV